MRLIQNGVLILILVFIWSYGLFFIAKEVTLFDKTDPPTAVGTGLYFLGVIVYSVIILKIGEKLWKEKSFSRYPTYKH